MSHFSRDTIRTILERANAEDIIGRYLRLVRKGNRLWGLSPFKSEKTPSFCVDPIKKMYYCFSTHQGGDIYTFIQKVEGVDFSEAVRILAREVGMELPQHTASPDHATYEIKKILAYVSRLFEHYFWEKDEGNAARAFMEERSIGTETLKSFHIGYAPSNRRWLFSFLRKKKYTPEMLSQLGLFSKDYPEICLFSSRIMFPIYDSSHSIVGFGGRLIGTEGPKYINSPQSTVYRKRELLYGLGQGLQVIKTQKSALIVEGYLDVLALAHAGITSAVAPLGTAFSTEQARLLRRVADEVIMCFDSDTAGWNATIRCAMACESASFPSIKILPLQEKDPSDILRIKGTSALRVAAGKEATVYSWFEYYLQKIFPGIHASYQEKQRALDAVIHCLASVRTTYKRTSYMHQTAEIFSTEYDTLTSALRSFENQLGTVQRSDSNLITPDSKATGKIHNTSELVGMTVLCVHPEWYLDLRDSCKPTDLNDANARKIYLALEAVLRNNEVTTHAVLRELSPSLSKKVAELVANGEASRITKDAFVRDMKYLMKRNRLGNLSLSVDTEIRKINAVMRKETTADAKKKVNSLLAEKQYYVRMMSELAEERTTHHERI